MKAIEYVSPTGVVIELLVPWGDGSGNIPPPSIEFHGGERFRYVGDRPTPENVECPTCGGEGLLWAEGSSFHDGPCPDCTPENVDGLT